MQTIFSNFLRHKPQNPRFEPIVYVTNVRPEVIIELCRGYNHPQSALPCGTILREALRYEAVAGIILYDKTSEGNPAVKASQVRLGAKQSGDGIFWEFFGWINRGTFEVSADAFTTFRVGSTVLTGPTFLTRLLNPQNRKSSPNTNPSSPNTSP